MLNGGTELKGLVRYNGKTGVVSFESGRDSRSLTSRNLTGFEYFDERQSRQRIFYSLPYEDPVNNTEASLFFEVLRQYKDFAMLAKTDPLDVKQRQSNTHYDPMLKTYTGNNANAILNLKKKRPVF